MHWNIVHVQSFHRMATKGRQLYYIHPTRHFKEKELMVVRASPTEALKVARAEKKSI